MTYIPQKVKDIITENITLIENDIQSFLEFAVSELTEDECRILVDILSESGVSLS